MSDKEKSGALIAGIERVVSQALREAEDRFSRYVGTLDKRVKLMREEIDGKRRIDTNAAARRERIAMHVLAGMASNSLGGALGGAGRAAVAVAWADALIEELDRTP